ncbi:MAG: selenite/tellurite reduction operon c-type cytochrome lipoprotein ExtS [Desulfuromonadaceae bacterium]|nr:selenite/tellurite reduction operon c-type cytochrome lipoprotein ExtS [Desulfuromonadaceae bacterium]
MGLRTLCLSVLVLVALSFPAVAQQCTRCHASQCPAPSVRLIWNGEQLSQCVECHRGNLSTTRKNLAHSGLVQPRHSWYTYPQGQAVQQGEKLTQKFACRRCHVTGEKGNNLATSLDSIAPGRSSVELELSVREPAVFMPLFPLTDTDLDLILTRILAGGLAAPKEQALISPLVVYFSHAAAQEDPFSRHCGGCHRMLSHKYGGLGTDVIGPNLSGMGTQFYPPTGRDNKPWKRDDLRDWVKNPRKIRALATMPPLSIQDEELRQVLDIVWHQSDEGE